MVSLPITYVIIFAILLLANYVAGGVMTSRSYHDANKDRADLREERRGLFEENRRLHEEIRQQDERIIKLHEEILELKTRMAAYKSEVDRLSSSLPNAGNM